ncbi:MAG: substrate-binding domain-containing protein [Proteobacteria bacterium]|nr:substrate-binding domain-containing protein [Pseudomonadota bacterium]
MKFQKRRLSFFHLTAVMMLILTAFSAYANDIVFVINKDVKTDKVTREELRDMFLGNISVWPDQQKVNFVTLGDPETHKTFVRAYIRKTESQFQAWWKRRLFTGTGKVPLKFKSEQDVIDYVARTEGGLGYVSSKAAIGGTVKILTVTDN